MMLNAGKRHYICLRRNTESAIFYFTDQIHANRKEETILGIITDNRLYFYSHFKGLCKKASQKSSLLYRGLCLI